ncbi:hypothetical protein [Dyadobacter linearis]|uniref:hypothetical protein n=1 Tax=Dyadobacter linearis TaxID=2823330 RepID=UPI001BFC7F33|nr:hypothetical protein [Dyadobacter sp. CECT 9623]
MPKVNHKWLKTDTKSILKLTLPKLYQSFPGVWNGQTGQFDDENRPAVYYHFGCAGYTFPLYQ